MLKNPNPAPYYSRYTRVYYEHPNGGRIIAGTIMEETSSGCLVSGHGEAGFANVPASCLFGTRESAEAALADAGKARQKAYERNIRSVADLVCFVCAQCGESWSKTDRPAFDAFRAKASELLNVVLTDPETRASPEKP